MYICKKNSKNLLLLLLFTAFCLFLLEKSNIYAQSSSISASVRIAICGNNVVEPGEDCEPLTFNQMSCSEIGYIGEEVYCDNSCSYDIYECIVPELPPQKEEDRIEKEIEEIIKKDKPVIIVTPTLPFLKLFDLDNNGIIDRYEFIESVKLWGTYWRDWRFGSTEDIFCDLNKDGICDIVDLSILLYHTK